MNMELQDNLDTAIDRLNELLPTGDPLPKDRAVVLLGPGAKLDSMGFVNLLVAVEEELDTRHGITTVLSARFAAEGLEGYTIGDLQLLIGKVIQDRK